MNIQARYILQIGDFRLSETVIASWVIIAFIAVISYLLTRNLKEVPTSKTQIFLEFVVTKFDAFVRTTMGEKSLKLLPDMVPYLGGLFLFFILSNFAGLAGLRSPTIDLDTTLAWTSITIFMLYYVAFKSQGPSYLKGFLDPFPVFLPINLVGEIARPISLSFRPFGNIMGGTIIMGLVMKLLAYISELIPGVTIPFAQLIIPVPLNLYFDIFAGALQAFIFLMLTMIFVSIQTDAD
ncbi:F0F1 ATP synthase subunit A [Metaclostridioides mangenotii]|uniref:ATP synthase subunit a n=1 Tax=Metaclostridioides mangenotii TaxID=1540 RepID=A0ABS4EEF7_9FIRM|nr:FoF1 ATP synthase subunit a [Clostridioides mangenotii]MBP1856325.1 F-type H+-transporting ATPase subunit a [Clostridioides mangenotii]